MLHRLSIPLLVGSLVIGLSAHQRRTSLCVGMAASLSGGRVQREHACRRRCEGEMAFDPGPSGLAHTCREAGVGKHFAVNLKSDWR